MEELTKYQLRKNYKFLEKSKELFDTSISENLDDEIKEFHLINYSQYYYMLYCWLFEKDKEDERFKEELKNIKKSNFYTFSNNIKHCDVIMFPINDIHLEFSNDGNKIKETKDLSRKYFNSSVKNIKNEKTEDLDLNFEAIKSFKEIENLFKKMKEHYKF